MPQNKNDRAAIDSFWDIESLLPKKKEKKQSAARIITPAEVDLPLRGSTDMPAPSVSGAIPPPTGENGETDGAPVTDRLLFSYCPDGALITSVTVSCRQSGYNFYHRFLTDGERYLGESGSECEYIPFFSYIPQYSALTSKQLAYYLYLRDAVKRGETPRADISYLLLLIYEIINFPDHYPPSEGLTIMTHIWLSYRDSFSAIDKYLSEWMCDYCLLNRLSPPLDALDPILNKITEKASFKEFFLSGARDETEESSEPLAKALERFASSYNWRSSRFLTPENRPLFKKHVPGALSYLLEHASLKGARPVLRTLSRDAYTASLSAHSVKMHMDIEYLSFTESIELGAVVTAAVKYTENRIRAHLGVKARLKLNPLPEDVSRILEEYFDSVLPLPSAAKSVRPTRVSAASSAEEIPEYEKYYTPISTGFDPARAAEIEAQSWRVTEMLTPETDPPEETVVEVTLAVPAKEADPVQSGEELSPYKALWDALTEGEKKFIISLQGGKRPSGIEADATADSINEKAAELTSDILLEDSGDGYAVIEDYTEDAAAMTDGCDSI
ncbi:MAG: TerB N-terminal domain-containing protein [Clostridia bacterium]|nr:TerB N-terminal domain-containing protein [Clostridia bacterium]